MIHAQRRHDDGLIRADMKMPPFRRCAPQPRRAFRITADAFAPAPLRLDAFAEMIFRPAIIQPPFTRACCAYFFLDATLMPHFLSYYIAHTILLLFMTFLAIT